MLGWPRACFKLLLCKLNAERSPGGDYAAALLVHAEHHWFSIKFVSGFDLDVFTMTVIAAPYPQTARRQLML